MDANQRKNIDCVVTRVFTDPTLPAFMEASHKKVKITPQKNTSGQVEFVVEGLPEIIDQALTELYKNSPVGSLDFVKALKGLRSAIFALKSSGRNEAHS